MQHRGEIIQRAIRESGYPITKLTKRLGRSRRWIYHVFENDKVPINVILEIGDIIHYDFSQEINQLKKYKLSSGKPILNDPETGYKTAKEVEIEKWKNKYYNLLEKHSSLLESAGLKKGKKVTYASAVSKSKEKTPIKKQAVKSGAKKTVKTKTIAKPKTKPKKTVAAKPIKKAATKRKR